jgi:phospholipid transport system substrate-binding protein
MTTTNNAKKIILDKNLNKADKKKQLEKLALDSVDVEGLAKYTLGEERKKLNETQLKEYVNTFKVFFTKNLSL